MREVRDFSRLSCTMEMPDLLDVQLHWYEWFLQPNTAPRDRKKHGLQQVFKEMFPVQDIKGRYVLEFEEYTVGVPRYTIQECVERGLTYAAPLKAVFSLSSYEIEGEDRKFKEKITNECYLGDLPIMAEAGCFVINGAKRVIVNQLHRSPGVVFGEGLHPKGKRIFEARIIPVRGSWIEFLVDANDVMFISIDRRGKFPATVMLRALGHGTSQDILAMFYKTKKVDISARTKKDLVGAYLAQPVVNEDTGEILAECNQEIDEEILEGLIEAKVKSLVVLVEEEKGESDLIRNTLRVDPTTNEEEAIKRLYTHFRSAEEAPSVDAARALIQRMFFDPKRYDFGPVGRRRMNMRLGLKVPMDVVTITPDDLIAVVRYLVGLFNGKGYIDDIDHLGNRRVRTVGELLKEQFGVGMTRMVRTIRERLSLRDTENVTPQDLINVRTISTVVDSFFGSSQLSQFMDETNPLAELTHKRRVSALGPGGLTRERAGFEVRDVHYTHYGRLCPIETPEGPNIGLIASLTTYARINNYGFIETPYHPVKNGKVSEEELYLSADEEDRYTIAQPGMLKGKAARMVDETILCRRRGDFPVVPAKEVEYMDISPNQLVSVAAGLIPFLEHDDANRALMGSNMQRQAVPLLIAEPPFIGTGMEGKSAVDSRAVMVAKEPGVVESVDANTIIIRRTSGATGEDAMLDIPREDTYDMVKYRRSNQDTSVHQKPIVNAGQRVKRGQVIADGPGTQGGRLALGRNVTVAFMPWHGYNFEDAIIVSEALIIKDTYTSIHIEEYEVEVRDTKRGPEEITCEIPNISEEALKNLDETGIVRVGAEVGPGDILVGKVTPKGETELSAEERLLRAIFGEKAGDVRDSSLKVPPGVQGTVVDTRVFSRKERSKRAKAEDKKRIEELKSEALAKMKRIQKFRNEKLCEILSGERAREIRDFNTSEVLVKPGARFTRGMINRIDFTHVIYSEGICENGRKNSKAETIMSKANTMIREIEESLDRQIDKIVRGDELRPGVLQLVKVWIAKKRKMSVGDKMAGRHGNKGVVSKAVPVEDMPYLPDGTPIDIILNPLGVPSRMNVGQLLETHLGWAAQEMGYDVVTPVFNGATYDDVKAALKEANLPESGKTTLYDGLTGEAFGEPVTVGNMYVLKLGHLVDDKIHARSIGPYSLTTQQPLGGKSQFGGQRFGEMEVWALEAYGAAYTLQEILTVKSDDVVGRSRRYEAIVKGEDSPMPGIPESFNVLLKEMQALSLDVRIERKADQPPV